MLRAAVMKFEGHSALIAHLAFLAFRIFSNMFWEVGEDILLFLRLETILIKRFAVDFHCPKVKIFVEFDQECLIAKAM